MQYDHDYVMVHLTLYLHISGGKSTLKCKGAKIYKELPNDIMYCKSLNIFKNSIISHFTNLTCLVYLVYNHSSLLFYFSMYYVNV